MAYASAGGNQEIRCDAVAEIAQPRQELLEKARQADRRDFLHAREVQHGMHFAGAPLGFGGLLVRHGLQVLVDLLAAAQQRARHVVAQDQELRHLERRDHVAVDAPVHFECGERAQQHAPFVGIGHHAGVGAGHEVALMRGENAGGAVGALEKGADAREVKGFVAHHGADGDAAGEVGALLDPLDELPDVGARRAARGDASAASSQVEFRVSQSSEVSEPRTARAFSRATRQAAEDAAAVVAIQAHEFEHGVGFDGRRAFPCRPLPCAAPSWWSSRTGPGLRRECGSSDIR